MKKHLSGLLIAVCVFAIYPIAANARDNCRMFVFGDSLSDSGAQSKHSIFHLSGNVEPPSPPYAGGRYSDGRLWVEYLRRFLCRKGRLNSYAQGGSFTDFRNVDSGTLPGSGGLATQVDNVDDDDVEFDEDDVILLWAGGNDYVFDTLAGNPPDPTVVVGNIVDAVLRLADRGARRFVLPNLPALGRSPLASFADPTGTLAAALNSLTGFHNIVLAGAIADLNASGLDATPVDIAALFDAVLSDPAAFGFNNVTVPCLIQMPDLTRVPTGACPPDGDSFDATGVFFWDLLHPTTAVHRLIAATALGALGKDDDHDQRDHRGHREYAQQGHD